MIDCLCHLDSEKYNNPADALLSLYQQAQTVEVVKIFLVNMPGQNFGNINPFENEQIFDLLESFKYFYEFFPGINPLDKNALQTIQKYKERGAIGIKLHPRLHSYNIESPECLEIAKFAGTLEMPVIVCGFMDGIALKLGNLPESFGRFADKCPETKIMMAHAGGHKIIDSLMVMKSCPNLYLDLSFTLLYYRNCPAIMEEIKYAIKSSKAKRIMWGTDYPDRPYAETCELSIKEFRKMDLSLEIESEILVSNPYEFIKTTKT